MNYTDHFARRDADLPVPKFAHGTRVFAKFQGVPAAGSVLREHSDQVLIHLDLPIQTKQATHNVVWVPVKDARKMKELVI
jgi:hypothetical protein